MRIVIIGGSGLIGSRLATGLKGRGHEVVAPSRSDGFDLLTGAGLSDAMRGADSVVDVNNSPSFADEDVMRFFRTSTTNQMNAALDAGVSHFVALTIVGAEKLTESGYMRAKVAQEELIRESGVPHTLVRATQFCEFVGAICESCFVEDEYRMPDANLQPIGADDVASFLLDSVLAKPENGITEIGGPEALPFEHFASAHLRAIGDHRTVVTDPEAAYYGQFLERDSLITHEGARLAKTTFEQWLERRTPATA